MKLTEQVVSLELSKKLKELGVKQESLFYWNEKTKKVTQRKCRIVYTHFINEGGSEQEERRKYKNIPAYTVAELGEMLWDAFEKSGWDLIYKAYGEVFNFKGTRWIGELGIVNLMRRPDMGAKMLIYLLENDIIEV